MLINRRSLLISLPLIGLASKAFAADARLAPRTLGNPNAKVHVGEWFSMTCFHCAHFAKTVFPQVKTELIDTGRIFYTFNDYPLDQVSLLATMLARSLPSERYLPFVSALLASQERWAFARDIDPTQQLQKMSALAGISAEEFDKINKDETFRRAIVAQQTADQNRYNIEGTPYFRFNDIAYPQEVLTYDIFLKEVVKAEHA